MSDECSRYSLLNERGMCVPCESYGPCAAHKESRFNDLNCRNQCYAYYKDYILSSGHSACTTTDYGWVPMIAYVVCGAFAISVVVGLVLAIRGYRCRRVSTDKPPIPCTMTDMTMVGASRAELEMAQGSVRHQTGAEEAELLEITLHQNDPPDQSRPQDLSSGFQSRPQDLSSGFQSRPSSLPSGHSVMPPSGHSTTPTSGHSTTPPSDRRGVRTSAADSDSQSLVNLISDGDSS